MMPYKGPPKDDLTRLYRDYTQSEIGKKFGVSQSRVSRWLIRFNILDPLSNDLTRRFSKERRDGILPKREPSLIEIAWAAGFIEGEGSFSRASGCTPSISLSQVNKEPAEKIYMIFGGRLRKRRPKGKTRQPYYQWRVSGRRAEIVGRLIFPFLSKKRRSQARRQKCV